jgi:hypothetical protein
MKTLYVGKWNLIGSEISSNTFNTLNNNIGISTSNIHDMVATAYDYTTNLWSTNYAYGKDVMNIGEGYFVYPLTTALDGTTDLSADNTTTLNQYGTLNNANTTITKTIGAIAEDDYNGAKWVAMSNPYPANITTASFITDNSTYIPEIAATSTTIQGRAIYVYDPVSSSWTNNLLSSGAITTIKPGQGFMVATNVNNADVTFNFTKPTTANKAVKSTNNFISFKTTANNTTREALANVNEQASNDFDINDAYVMISTNNTNLVEPYFLVNEKHIMKDEFNTMPYYTPMNFHASKESNTNLTVNNIPENVNVSIIDLSNGTETALTNGSVFNFVANQGENEGRFVVKFGKNNVGIDNNAEENNISLAMYPNPATTQTTLFVDGLTNNAQVSICDVQGRIINNLL